MIALSSCLSAAFVKYHARVWCVLHGSDYHLLMPFTFCQFMLLFTNLFIRLNSSISYQAYGSGIASEQSVVMHKWEKETSLLFNQDIVRI